MPATRATHWVHLAAVTACLLGLAALGGAVPAQVPRRAVAGAVEAWSGRAASHATTAPPGPARPPSGWLHEGTASRGPPPPARAPPSPPLPEDHPLLSRAAGDGTVNPALPGLLSLSLAAPAPHAPEQVMLSFEGPGAVTVTWVTHPQVSGEERGVAGRRRGCWSRHPAPSPLLPRQDSLPLLVLLILHTHLSLSSQDDPSLRPRILAAAAAAAAEEEDLTRHQRHRPGGGSSAKAACRHLAGLPLASVARYARAGGAGALSAPTLSTGSFSCYAAGTYLSGALHRATMGPLEPGALYSYSVGDPARGWSASINFTAPLAPGAGVRAAPYTFAVVGDLGQTADSADTLAAIMFRGLGGATPGAVQSILNVGDLSYADGFQTRWDTFGRLISPLTSRCVQAVIEGNHEEELTGGKAGFVAYKARYATPTNASRSGTPLYYSYDTPSAHVVMLGTYADWGPSSPQRAWLAADLAGLDRARTPWLVVGMHAPWYSSNTAHLDEVEGMRVSLEPLLLEHGADLVFTGHVHAYERTHRVARRGRHGCGAAHVVIGDGGNREGLSLHYVDPQPRWSAYREASFGHGALTLVNTTHARWEWVRNQDGPGAAPGDAAWFVRGDGECAPGARAALVAGARAEADRFFTARPGGRTVGVGYATQVVGESSSSLTAVA